MDFGGEFIDMINVYFVFALYLYCICIVFVLYLYCICIVFVLYLYCICIVLYCIVLYLYLYCICIVLYCVVLYCICICICIVLYCIVFVLYLLLIRNSAQFQSLKTIQPIQKYKEQRRQSKNTPRNKIVTLTEDTFVQHFHLPQAFGAALFNMLDKYAHMHI